MKLPIGKIICGDCLPIIEDWPDNCVDLVLTDPPFGIGNFIQVSGQLTGKGSVRGKSVTWNEKTPPEKYFQEIKRISKHRIIWGANYFNCFENIGGAIVWVKNQPMPNFSKADIASCSFHKKIELFNYTWTNFVNTKVTEHPSERPLALYLWCLERYSDFDALILDTHCGSGSVCIAAKILGRRYIGIDISSEYCEVSRKRLRNMRPRLFENKPKKKKAGESFGISMKRSKR